MMGVIRLGHRIIHAGIFAGALTRAVAYAPLPGGPHEATGPVVLSDDGKYLPLYAAAWALSAVLSLIWAIRGRGGFAILFFAFLLGTWALGYAAAWIMAGFDGPSWMTFFLYGSYATVVIGVYYLLEALRAHRGEQITEAIQTVTPRQEGPREP